MKKVFKFLNKIKIEALLSIFLVVVISMTTFAYLVPFKSFGDLWAHLAAVEELKKPFNEIGDPYFNTGIKDPHYGPYVVAIAQISNITGVNHIVLMEVFGVVSVVFLYLSTLYAYYKFFPDRKNFKIDKIVLLISVFLLWESNKISYAGYYSLADISITTLFPHTFALGLFMIGIGQMIDLFEFQANLQKITKELLWKYLKVAGIAAFIVLTHIITGVVFFYSYAAIAGYYFLTKYKGRFTAVFLSNIIVPIIALSLCFLWPYYNILSPFQDLQTVHTEQPIVAIFEISTWLSVAGIAFLGIIAAMKTKNKLLVFWFASLALIVASYLYPIRISSYWRFFPVMLVPLFFLVTEWISKLNNVMRTFLLFMLLVFGFSSFVNKVDSIGTREAISPTGFDFLNVVPKGSLILSDPETSYFFSGLTGHAVLSVTKTHWNPANQVLAQERYDDTLSFWGENDVPEATYMIKKYNIEYVLINKKMHPNFGDYATKLGNEYKIKELYQDNYYLLLQIKHV